MHSVLALENRSMKKELENATDALMPDVGREEAGMLTAILLERRPVTADLSFGKL